MIRADIEATLTNGQQLPEPIAAICTYLDQSGYPISGCFELSTIGVVDLTGWFEKSPETVFDFIPFGRGATGDVYAIWLVEGSSSDSAPVVMFGSEGDLKVLAINSFEFCRLLCVGYNELGYDDDSVCISDESDVRRFREFMEKRFGFTTPRTGEAIVKEAASAYPNFQKWVEQRAWDGA